jgi:hypothetical protein
MIMTKRKRKKEILYLEMKGKICNTRMMMRMMNISMMIMNKKNKILKKKKH